MENQTLLIHYDISKPVEVSDFVKSLNAVSSLYSSYAKENGACSELHNAKLCVEKIQEGSIDVFLTLGDIAASILPFAETVNIIHDFAVNLQNVTKSLLSGSADLDKFTKKNCQDYKDLVSVTARDNRGNMDVKVFAPQGNMIFTGCSFNSCEANALQNQSDNAIERISKDDDSPKRLLSACMTISQMKTDRDSTVGNKAVIDEFDKRAAPVGFASEDLKSKILFSDMNPANYAFIVDVDVLKVGGKNIYRVIALHDTIDLL